MTAEIVAGLKLCLPVILCKFRVSFRCRHGTDKRPSMEGRSLKSGCTSPGRPGKRNALCRKLPQRIPHPRIGARFSQRWPPESLPPPLPWPSPGVPSLALPVDPIFPAIEAHREAVETFQTAYKRLLALPVPDPDHPLHRPMHAALIAECAREGVDRYGAEDSRRVTGAGGASS